MRMQGGVYRKGDLERFEQNNPFINLGDSDDFDDD